MQNTNCLYDRWYDGDVVNINNFHQKLFELFQLADGINKAIILAGWPVLFRDSNNI
jgi:hypothetical protein